MKTLFKLENVTFAYPYEQDVLKDIDLEVFEGERICILGANGCGKSTLLKIFTGLLYPQKGSFTAFENNITEKTFNDEKFSKAYHSKVGFIFQDSDSQLFCSTATEEIAFGLLQQDLPKEVVQKRIKDIVRLLGIEQLTEKTPFRLSGGEKKKVALAAVLSLSPDVLILDEPTNSLDPRTQKWLLDLLFGLSASGKTIITSTHDLNLALKISERAILFDENHRIVADLPTKEVLNDVNLLKKVNLVDEDFR